MQVLHDLSQLKAVYTQINHKENNLNPEPVLEINRTNMTKYLEKYACKDEQDLSDTLWYSYGVFLRILD